MTDTDAQTLRPFFEAFERSAAASDTEGLARLYAPTLLVAGPNGAQVVKLTDLLLAIPKRKQLFEAMGCGSARLVALREITLDERYTLVHADWQWRVRSEGRTPTELTLPSTFIVQRSSGDPRIIFYLMHQDIMSVLRERGRLPADPSS
jgi:hypothetical protein